MKAKTPKKTSSKLDEIYNEQCLYLKKKISSYKRKKDARGCLLFLTVLGFLVNSTIQAMKKEFGEDVLIEEIEKETEVAYGKVD